MEPIFQPLAYLIYGCYAALLLVAALYDVCRFIIPNAISLGLVLLFVAMVVSLPVDLDWPSHVGAAAAVFVGCALLYRLGKLGGGDVKLMSAAALWAGLEHLPDLLIYVAFAGGALALALVVVRRIVAAAPGQAALPRVLRVGEGVPYGAAIATGGVLLVARLPIPGAAL